MQFVFNEWFLDWHKSSATKEETQKVKCIFAWYRKSEHVLVILNDSPFITKLNKLRKGEDAYADNFAISQLKVFYRIKEFDPDRVLSLDDAPKLDEQTMALLSRGNYMSDRYLFETAMGSVDKIIITTDEKLRKQFANQQLFQLWSVDQFMNHFNIQC